MRPKSIVTGGAGFIGSAVVRELLANGESRVGIVDNLNSGKLSNLDAVKDQIETNLVDIRHHDELVRVFQGAEVVYHLAAIPSVPRSINDPVPSHDVNINGTFNVYRAAQQAGVRRVVYAASSSVYGDTDVLPKTETMAPRPKSPYALQKLTGEYYGSVFASCFGVESVSLRFFNVYGPRQDPTSPYSGVLSLFMRAALTRTAPTIFGDGEQSRDFTYVDDVAALVRRASTAPGVSGKVFNAGNGGRYTLNFLWEQVQKLEGISLPPNYGPLRDGDVRDSQADTQAAMRELGHSPRYSIEEGLRRTHEWYRIEHA
ncbi:MAG: SDR family oxidoreductase [Bryobacteraceae bacterium]